MKQLYSKLFFISILFLPLVLMSSCGTIKLGNQNELQPGKYKISGNQTIYVEEDENNEIQFYEQSIDSQFHLVQTIRAEESKRKNTSNFTLKKNSFDIDLMTVPLKLRPSIHGVPTQLNTVINANLYLGFRRDYHSIRYKSNFLGQHQRKISNIGFSLGLITGLGNALINETTTLSRQHNEYDGIVWMNGLNIIAGWNAMTFGLAVGKDLLLDQNRSIWIYDKQFWYGLTIGINLN